MDKLEGDDVLDYLAGGGKSLRQQYTEVFGKINLADDAFETRVLLKTSVVRFSVISRASSRMTRCPV